MFPAAVSTALTGIVDCAAAARFVAAVRVEPAMAVRNTVAERAVLALSAAATARPPPALLLNALDADKADATMTASMTAAVIPVVAVRMAEGSSVTDTAADRAVDADKVAPGEVTTTAEAASVPAADKAEAASAVPISAEVSPVEAVSAAVQTSVT